MGFKLTMVAIYLSEVRVPQAAGNDLENFYINRFGRKLYSMFLKVTEAVGPSPQPDFRGLGLPACQGLSIMGVLKNAFRSSCRRSAIPKRSRPADRKFWYRSMVGQRGDGRAQLWQAGAKVITGAKVVEVRQEGGKIASVVYVDQRATAPSSRLTSSSSMPVKDLINAVDESDKPAPKDITEIASGLPYRDFVTVSLLVKHLRLKNTTDIPTLGNPPIVPDCCLRAGSGLQGRPHPGVQ